MREYWLCPASQTASKQERAAIDRCVPIVSGDTLPAWPQAPFDGAFTRIIHEATAQLLDRVKNGDPVMVAGTVKRKPVSARDLALVAAITYDKRALVCNLPEQPLPHRLSFEELAHSLRAYAQAKERTSGDGSRR